MIDLVLLFSDWHVGRETDDYNLEAFNTRLKKLIDETLKYKSMLNKGGKIADLNVMFLGDIIDGEGIYYQQPYESPYSAEYIVDYTLERTEKEFMRFKDRFRNVNIYTVYGNHGRTNRYRQSNWDNVLYKRLRDRLEPHGFNFHIGSWKNFAEVGGIKMFLIHGDGINMYQNIPFYGITQRVMRYKASNVEFDMLLLGHFHTTFWYSWNEVEIAGNGTLLSSDEWIEKQLALKPQVKQWLFAVDRYKSKILWRMPIEVTE